MNKRKWAVATIAIVAVSVPIVYRAAVAALTPNSFITAQTPSRGLQRFVQGTDTAGTYKTLYTGGTNGSACKAIWMDNTDATATHLVTFQIFNGGNGFGGVAVTTVLNAGAANATPPQPILTAAVWPGLPLDQNGNFSLPLNSGDTLQATFATALTTSTQINIHAVCSDF